MRTEYRIGSAKLQTSEKRAGCWTLEWLYVPPEERSNGLGKQLMTMLLGDADREHVSLVLEAVPCAKEGTGPNEKQLVAWYEGFGFEPSGLRGERGGLLMVRTPVRLRSKKAV